MCPASIVDQISITLIHAECYFCNFALVFKAYKSEIRMESTRSSRIKWTKTQHKDCLHRNANLCSTADIYLLKNIISSNTKRRKQVLNFERNA